MKPLILPLVAFLAFFALGGGAGAYVMRPAGSDSTHVDSTHADSTHGEGAPRDPGHAGSSTGDTASTSVPHDVDTGRDGSTAALDAHAADPSRAVAGTTPAGSPDGATHSSTAPPGTTPAGTTPARPGQLTIGSLLRAQSGGTVTMGPDGTIGGGAPDSLPDYARMARLLSRMGPREAARTIERLGGTEAARALAAMSDKQAALVLSQLTPEKAASLLQATLALLPKTVAP
ncbi:MAG: hypothetical protein K8S21_08810 [Gemmatimonadetes bacterium]|nr:hypothetical protein [Gemmatimonadota bacterium]